MMKLTPFLLEKWLDGHIDPPVEFNLGGSTGPVWTAREVLDLDGARSLERLLDKHIVYSRSAGGSSLRQALADMHGVPMEQMLVTTGAAEALVQVFLVAAEPGSNVVVPQPCFPPHAQVPESLGLEVRSYGVRRDRAFQIDLQEVMGLVDAHTRLILVNSPHNPTGTTISDKDMLALHDFAAERSVQFVSDEVYHPIYHGPASASAATLAHATVISDLSKAFSLSGLRLGWIREPDVQRRERYLSIREFFTISNSPITELLGEIAVRHRDAIFRRTREVASANLELLDQVIAAHQDVLRWVRPRGGMTGFPWLVSGANARAFCEEAVRVGLLLVPGDCFGVPDHVRMGFGVGREWYARAMERLSGFLAGQS